MKFNFLNKKSKQEKIDEALGVDKRAKEKKSPMTEAERREFLKKNSAKYDLNKLK